MKKLLTVIAAFVAFTAASFADEADTLTNFGGFGMGGSFVSAKSEKGSQNLSSKAFTFLDLNGVSIFNKTNIAITGNMTFGIGSYNDNGLDEAYEVATHLSANVGVGYCFKYDKLYLIPAFAVSVMKISSEHTSSSALWDYEETLDIFNVGLGTDLRAIYRCSKHFSLEASCLVTATVYGNVSYDHKDKMDPTENKSYDTDLKKGKFSFMPAVGICWAF